MGKLDKRMKKKGLLFILALLLPVLLSACSRKAETGTATEPAAKPKGTIYTLETPYGSVQGYFSGRATEGVPDGEGTFTALAGGWRFTGSVSQGVPGSGSVEDMPWTLSGVQGRYSGETDALVPQGQGSYSSAEGGFSGRFEDGLPADGQAADTPITVLWQGETLNGLYNGEIVNGVPEGEGRFATAGGRSLTYEGRWDGGVPAGEGTLTDDGLFLTVEGELCRGRYEGAALDGVPSGEGVFAGRTAENIDFTYAGDWENGLFHGEGKLIYNSQLYYQRVGTFTEGVFTPDWHELLRAIGSVEPYFTLSPQTEAYLAEYPELLDTSQAVAGYNESDYRREWNRELTYEVYLENPEDYQQSWMLFYSYVVLNRLEDETFGDNWRFTRLICSNSVYTNPMICYYFGDAPELDKMTRITFFGIPLGLSSYVNSDGEDIPAIVVLLGSYYGF